MASPQKEDGYTAIANELMEALTKYRIPGEQMQCLLFILRKTYGFNKKNDCISNSQFVRATGLSRQNVYRAINSLIDKNIVVKKDYNPHPKYCFNKNYETWEVYSKKTTCSQKRVKSVVKKETHKRQYTKDIVRIEKFEVFWSVFNDKRGKNPALKSWLKIPNLENEFERIIEGAKRYSIERKKILSRGGTPKMAQGWLTDRRWEDEINAQTKRTYVNL